MNAGFISAAIGARLMGDGDAEFSRVGTDSRAGAGADLFVALVGERFDGNEFIDDAVAHGARGVICARGRAKSRANVTYFEVDDTLRALGDLAAARRLRFDVPVVAITGSNGKTTTKNLLRSILATGYGDSRFVLATEGNFNNLIGMPLTLLRLDSHHRAAVLEMGMSVPGEIARLTEIAAPTHGLITCISAAHLAGLGSIEGIARAKGELFAGLKADATAVVNLADERVVAVAAGHRGKRIEFGPGGAVRAENIQSSGLAGTRFLLVLPGGSAEVRLPLLGSHNVANALAAAACASALGIGIDSVVAGLESAEGAPMRLSVERLPNGVDLINDAYNANPGSMQAALSSIAELPSRRFVVLGDMLELGQDAPRLHAEVGAAAARADPRLLCAVGVHASDTIRGAHEAGMADERTKVAGDQLAAAAWVAELWRAGDTVLVKGSRGARMEVVVSELQRRGKA